MDFLQKMIRGDLPISNHAIEMTKSLLFLEELPDGWKLFGKTGLGSLQEDTNKKIGWFIGWIEKGEDVFVFTYNIQDTKVDPSLRIPRVKQLLSESRIMDLKEKANKQQGLQTLEQKKSMDQESKSIANDVFLNHIYMIIDENIYEEIQKSKFLNENFCHCAEKSAGNNERSWTGFYLMGENTYIEFFNKKDKSHLEAMEIDEIGIALSVDQNKNLEQIVEKFQKEMSGDAASRLLEAKINDSLIPWFYYVQPSGELSMRPEINIYLMSYHRDFFKFRNIEITNGADITREEYNKTSAIPFDQNKLFKDIEEITLTLSEANKNKFIKHQKFLGYSCKPLGDTIVCRGPGITFNIKASDGQKSRVSELCLRLNQNVDDMQVFNFGSSTLRFKNDKAFWRFQ